MKITRLLIVSLLCAGVASVAEARKRPLPPAVVAHHTITPSVANTNSPGVWTYSAELSSGRILPGDGFTIFDFSGYVANSIFAPADWTATAGAGSVLNAPPPTGMVDNPAIPNLLFTFNGTDTGAVPGKLGLGDFGAETTDTSTALGFWSSRDHIPVAGANPPQAENHSDRITVPAAAHVPDGGATVALLGVALAGIEGLRRLIRARKV